MCLGTAVNLSILEKDFSAELRPLLTHVRPVIDIVTDHITLDCATQNINYCLVKKANWVLIRVKDKPRDYSCYVVHHSRSDIVYLSYVRKRHHKDAILLALCNTLGCGDWLELTHSQVNYTSIHCIIFYPLSCSAQLAVINHIITQIIHY